MKRISIKATKIATIGGYRIYKDPIEGDEAPLILTNRYGDILTRDMWGISDYIDKIEKGSYKDLIPTNSYLYW